MVKWWIYKMDRSTRELVLKVYRCFSKINEYLKGTLNWIYKWGYYDKLVFRSNAQQKYSENKEITLSHQLFYAYFFKIVKDYL